MSDITVYEENVSQSSVVVSRLANDVLPAMGQSIAQNMPQFVSAFKEIKTLQIEREFELRKFMAEKESGLEKFQTMAASSQQRLNEQMGNITQMIQAIIGLNPQTPTEMESKKMLVMAMTATQQAYLKELEMLLNL